MKIVIASYTPYLNDVDDAILKKYLINEKVEVEIVSWDNQEYDWESCDAIIIRSTWDYHQHLSEYVEWLNYLQTLDVLVFNDPDVILNNIFKDKQIKWLIANNIPCLPSKVFSLNDKSMIYPEKTLLETLNINFPDLVGKSMFVIKPSVSARSYNTFLIDPYKINCDKDAHVSNDPEKIFFEMLEKFCDRGIIIQKYATGVADGEYGLVFLNNKLTQIVRKKPGIIHGKKEKMAAENVPDSVVELGKNVVNLLSKEKVLIARVDIVYTENKAIIMELELAEPNIYIRENDGIGLGINDPEWYLTKVQRLGCHNDDLIFFAHNIVERVNKRG